MNLQKGGRYCGNKVMIPAPIGKYTQFRDYLEGKQFRFGSTDIKNGVLKAFKIECSACNRQITLGVD